MVRFKRIPLQPAGGGGPHFPLAEKSIRLARWGCSNRPFYYITVAMTKRHQHDQPIEQIGTFDPLPNQFNEKLVSLNIERLQYWMSQNTVMSKPVAELLGLAGYLPVHPYTFVRAWRNRKSKLAQLESQKTKESATDSESSPS